MGDLREVLTADLVEWMESGNFHGWTRAALVKEMRRRVVDGLPEDEMKVDELKTILSESEEKYNGSTIASL